MIQMLLLVSIATRAPTFFIQLHPEVGVTTARQVPHKLDGALTQFPTSSRKLYHILQIYIPWGAGREGLHS